VDATFGAPSVHRGPKELEPLAGLPTTPNVIPGGDILFIDGRKLAAGETFFGVLDARTRVLENLG